MLKQSNYSNKTERGAVLVISLLFLMILTLIGISSAKTSVLQEKIAGHSGLQQSAFQAADSCTNRMLRDRKVYTFNASLNAVYDGAAQYLVSNSITNRSGYIAEQLYAGKSNPPRGTGYSAKNFQVFHNEQRCEGLTESSPVNVTIRQGFFQVFPKL
ncbi:MAG: pilus assembly PilX N-terminal domain-containing protein [Gammaproteobacteria bacterium]|nr:pilus assembly PilX N-terminal domain-containing protein [Gammaproteobacteria bacterium]